MVQGTQVLNQQRQLRNTIYSFTLIIIKGQKSIHYDVVSFFGGIDMDNKSRWVIEYQVTFYKLLPSHSCNQNSFPISIIGEKVVEILLDRKYFSDSDNIIMTIV